MKTKIISYSFFNILLFVTISNVYAQDSLRDIKSPVGLAMNIDYVKVLTVLAIFLLIAAISFFVNKIPKKKTYAPINQKTPSEIASLQLAELKAKALAQQGKIKEYYTILANIIRYYIENQFRLKAPEMTTEEFLYNVRNSDIIKMEHLDLLSDFFVCCDMAKFAKYSSNSKEIDKSFESARKFIEETKDLGYELMGDVSK